MNATLDELILFTARQTKREEDVVKSGGVYIEDALVIVNKFIDGFNYAKNKIIRERYRPTHKETVLVGPNNAIDLTTMSKTVMKVNEVYESGTLASITNWGQGEDFTLYLPYGSEGMSVDIEYAYKVPDFPNNPSSTDLEMVLDFPEALVDFRILGYYSAYEYHLIKGSDRDLDKTGFFLSKFNDGFLHIPRTVKGFSRVKDRARY